MIYIRWVFDLDGTICDTTYDPDTYAYIESVPRKEVVEKINELYDMGEHITIFTARGAVHKKDWGPETKKQLEDWGVKYHELRFGKPGGEIYVDDRTISPEELIDRWSFYVGICAQWKVNK